MHVQENAMTSPERSTETEWRADGHSPRPSSQVAVPWLRRVYFPIQSLAITWNQTLSSLPFLCNFSQSEHEWIFLLHLNTFVREWCLVLQQTVIIWRQSLTAALHWEDRVTIVQKWIWEFKSRSIFSNVDTINDSVASIFQDLAGPYCFGKTLPPRCHEISNR